MPNYYTRYWTNSIWQRNKETQQDGKPLLRTGSNLFRRRGVSVEDILYVVTVVRGRLYLIGSMEVGRICSREETAVILGVHPDQLPARREHVLAARATPMALDHWLPLAIVRQLRFISGEKDVGLVFRTPTELDPQTLRSIRQLTEESAKMLDEQLPPREATEFDWGLS